jgi:Zn-finger nucleic acid-binding protein
MKKVTKNKITIDICPNCNGMFLDDGEIEKLLKVPPIKKTKTKKQSK